jgi:plasmid stability protein
LNALLSLTAMTARRIFQTMATLTIRNLPDAVRDKLRVRAAQNGRSMEAEARRTLVEAFSETESEERPSAAERVAQAQRAFAPYRRPGVSIVDELIKERREAAARGD